jgi:transposase
VSRGEVDVILGKARRRRSDEEERTLVAETLQPGSSVDGVARRHEISPSLLFSWRKQLHAELGFVKDRDWDCTGFTVVAIAGPETEAVAKASEPPPGEPRVEIRFADGAQMMVTGTADPALVMAVTKALARR